MLAGCGAGAGLGPVEAGPPETVADLSDVHFDTLVGMPFLFEDQEGQTYWLDLEDIAHPTVDPEYSPDETFRDPFSLVFRGDHDVILDEGRYAVLHPEFDVFDLHVVPRMPGDEGTRYEIIFT